MSQYKEEDIQWTWPGRLVRFHKYSWAFSKLVFQVTFLCMFYVFHPTVQQLLPLLDQFLYSVIFVIYYNVGTILNVLIPKMCPNYWFCLFRLCTCTCPSFLIDILSEKTGIIIKDLLLVEIKGINHVRFIITHFYTFL